MCLSKFIATFINRLVYTYVGNTIKRVGLLIEKEPKDLKLIFTESTLSLIWLLSDEYLCE